MCPDCDGLGTRYTFDPDLLIPDPSLSFYDGAIPLVGPLQGHGPVAQAHLRGRRARRSAST